MELFPLIQKYNLDASSALDVIPVARQSISKPEDYIRFLELSLEGRIYGEIADHLQRAERATTANTEH